MIEKIIHFTVPHAVSVHQKKAIDIARTLHPDWRVLVWQDPIDSKDFELSEFWPFVNSGAQLADLIRIEVVFQHGGIYLDSDVILQKPLDDLSTHLDFFVASEDGWKATNAVFGASQHHPVLRQMIDELRTVAVDWSMAPNVTTGPEFFSRVLKWRKDATVIPRESFYPYNWNEQPGPVHRHSYGVHEWARSWWFLKESKPSNMTLLRSVARSLAPKRITRWARSRYLTWRDMVKDRVKSAIQRMAPQQRCYGMLGNLMCQTIYGHSIILDGSDVSITPEIVKLGCYEPREEALICRSVKGGDLFIDVGANVGMFSLLAASRVGPFGRVFAYEPNPAAAELLAKSAVMNWMHERIIVRRVAVGSMAGSLELSFCPARLGDASIKTEKLDSATFARTAEYISGLKTLPVPVVTLDDEFPYDIPIKFLKVDAEGYEVHVLTGARRLIKHRCIDYLMLEAVQEVAGEQWPRLVDAISEVCSMGYAPFAFGRSGELLPISMRDIRNGSGLTTRNVVLKAMP